MTRSSDSFGWHYTNVLVGKYGEQFWQGSLVRAMEITSPGKTEPQMFRCFRDDKDGEYYPFSYVTKGRYSAADLDACESIRAESIDALLIVAVTPDVVIVHFNETLYAILRHWFVNNYFTVIARPST